MILAPLFLVPAVLIGPAADAPAPRNEEMEALLARLRGPSAEDRLAAAKAIEAEPPSGIELYGQRLRRVRPVAADTFRKVILETWAQVPDPNYAKTGNLWLQKPEPPWKPSPPKKGQPRARRPPPHDPEKVEWLTALAQLDVEGNPVLAALPDRVEARAEALEAVALLHAIATAGRSGNARALDPAFDFAFDLDGVFRDECGRAIRAMDSFAIPNLIRRMRMQATKELKGTALFRMKRYASYQLDRMDRAQPHKSISTAPDDRIRAAIIHAYGEVRALDAVEAILGQVDAPSHRVREEARWAWLRYVTGPPPPDAPKRKRKLPGGKAESEEKEDYLNYREMAVLALNKVLETLHEGGPCANCAKVEADGKPSTKADAKKMTDEVFAFYDKRRAAEWDAEWNAARAKAAAGDLAGAVAEFGVILARDPLYERRAEMAETFYAYGASLQKADPMRALAVLRQAVALGPTSPKSVEAEARIAEISGVKTRRDTPPDRTGLVRGTALASTLLAAAALVIAVVLLLRRRRAAD